MAPTLAISDIADFVLYKGNGVKGLSETGIKVLPLQYIQPIEERLDLSKMVNTGRDQDQNIPIIDMSNWENNAKFPKLVCEAAEKWGFFQIINHGVDIEVFDNVKKATHRFFGLSCNEKIKYLKENSGTKNVRFGTSFSPEAEASLEWKDYLSLFYVSDDEASSFWPPSCRDEVLEYMKKTNTVIKQLLSVLMKGLNVDGIDETKENLLMGSRRINLNYYPICPNPELTVGVGRHSDVSTLTILLQDDIGGLYVRGMTGDDWIHVAPIKGSLVINVGDALQILSNGKYKSVEHRVIANGTKNRISVPIFVNPRPGDVIGPLPEVTANGEKPIYKQVVYSDYVRHFFRKAHDGKNTIDFASI